MGGYMDINGFISTLAGADGIARQNKYTVLIPTTLLASNSSHINTANSDVLEFGDIEATDWSSEYLGVDMQKMGMELTALCERSQLPSYQFAVTTNRHYGPAFKVPHLPEYQDVTMSFICGGNMSERAFFDTWMYLVMDPVTNNFNYIHEYALDIDIVQYKERATSLDIANLSLSNTRINAKQPFIGNYTNLMLDANVDCNYYTTLVDAFPVSVSTQELGYSVVNTMQTVEVTFVYKFAIPFEGKGSTDVARRGGGQSFRSTITAPSNNVTGVGPGPLTTGPFNQPTD
jgi:hypothetical protein